MAEPNTFASLSSSLLARKGAAKPAMRPQGWGQGVNLEDLGWNDMGHGQHAPAHHYASHEPEPAPEHVPSSIAALTPSPRSHFEPRPVEQPVPVAEPAAVASPPPVVEQQRAVEAAFAPEPRAKRQAVKPRANGAPVKLPRDRTAPGGKAKAAFTLRLDPDRHLKLRLACAVTHRSAQQIVTEALDDFLASISGLDALASQLPAKAAKRN